MSGSVNLDRLMPSPSILYQDRRQATSKGGKDLYGSFANILDETLSNVNNLGNKSDILTQKLVTGEIDNVHEVMIAAQKAEIALELTMEIRNKVIAAYDKIMAMGR